MCSDSVFVPRNSSSLHLVCHSHISGPDVILPSLLAQHSTQDCPSVDTHPHVNVCLSFLTNIPADGDQIQHTRQDC